MGIIGLLMPVGSGPFKIGASEPSNDTAVESCGLSFLDFDRLIGFFTVDTGGDDKLNSTARPLPLSR